MYFSCNAKYLWKRIPQSVKGSTPELTEIWAVGQSMWKRDFPAIYKALNAVTWSDTVAEVMKQLEGIFLLLNIPFPKFEQRYSIYFRGSEK